jgi:hypothetical protein
MKYTTTPPSSPPFIFFIPLYPSLSLFIPLYPLYPFSPFGQPLQAIYLEK